MWWRRAGDCLRHGPDGVATESACGAPRWPGQLIGMPPTPENVGREAETLWAERHETGPHRKIQHRSVPKACPEVYRWRTGDGCAADIRVCCSECCRTSERNVFWNDIRHFAAFALRLMILMRLAPLAVNTCFEENVAFAGNILVDPRRCTERVAALANARRSVLGSCGIQPVARGAH